MLDELFATTGTLEYEEFGATYLTGARSDGRTIRLSLMVAFDASYLGPARRTRWEVVCRGARSHRLRLGEQGDPRLSDDHVLLWPHTHPILESYVRSEGADPLPAVGALYRRHHDLLGVWFDVDAFVRPGILWTYGGLLGRGPEPVMLAYAEELRSHGFRVSHLRPRPPEERRPRVLTVGGSFAVADDFRAHRRAG